MIQETTSMHNRVEIKLKDPTDFEQLVQFLTEETTSHFYIKTINGDLHFFERGVYVAREDRFLAAWLEKKVREYNYEDKYSTKIVNEVIFHVKNRTYTPIEELEKYHFTLAFDNGFLDLKKFVETGDIFMEDFETLEMENYQFLHEQKDGTIEYGLHARITPIASAAEKIVLHKIPITIVNEPLIKGMSIDEAAKLFTPKTYRFFQETVGDENIPLQYEKIGYALWPEQTLQMAFMEVGSGSNGKSTFLRLLSSILGENNFSNVALQDLNERFGKAEIFRKLANICADLPKWAIKDTGPFKMLTGEDRIRADRKHKEPINFVSYATPFFAANELPRVSDDTYAFWRRWILTEYPNTFKTSDNPTLFDDLLAEKHRTALIALYALRRVLLAKKFTISSDSDFKETWKRRASSVYRFIREAEEEKTIALETDAKTQKEDLYDLYTNWVEDPVDKAIFTKEIEKDFNIKPIRMRVDGKKEQFYQNIKILGNVEVGQGGQGGQGENQLYSPQYNIFYDQISQELPCPPCPNTPIDTLQEELTISGSNSPCPPCPDNLQEKSTISNNLNENEVTQNGKEFT